MIGKLKLKFAEGGSVMGMADEIGFKVSFLKAMTSVMTEPDLDTFTEICTHFAEGTAVLADLNLLDHLYKKFEKGETGAT